MASTTKVRANQVRIEELLNDPSALATETKSGTLRIATQPEVDAGTATDLAVTPATLSGALASRNWLYANDGDDFATAPQTSGSGAITIGDNSISYIQAVAIGGGVTAQQNSVAIGLASNASGLSALALGHLAQANSNYQVSIGYNMPTGSPEYSVRIGYAQADANLNYLRLRNKGQFEIFGDQAQFVLPNHSSGGSPRPLPTDAIEGALVYDTATKELRLHDGASWTALSGLFTEDGQFNIAGGTGSGAALLASAQFNFLGGAYAGDSITSGDRNVVVGPYAGGNITSTSFNVAVGNNAMTRTDSFAMGDFNVAIGSNAGRTIRSTGSDYNVFVGANSGSDSLAGGGNVQSNTGIGGATLTKLTAGGYSNVAIGRFSITNGTTIDRNTAVGTNTFRILDTGSNNVAMGYKSGYWVDGASSGNVIIGAYAGPTSTTVENNKLYINNAASATPLIGGDFATSAGSPLTGQVTIYGDLNSKGILTLSDGTVTQPSLVFEANSTSGMTSNGASGNLYFVSSGVAKFVITSGFNSSTVTHFFTTGSASTPSIGYSADTNTGIYFVNPGELHITTGGVDRLGVLSDGSLSVAGTANYENLVTDDDDIPNKKYVDDSIAIGGGAAYLDQLLDVTLTGSPAPQTGDVLIYSGVGSPVQWVHGQAQGLFTEDASRNIVGGTAAGSSFTTAADNFIGGYTAGDALTDGTKNVILGNYAGTFLTTGSKNVIIGYQALDDNDTASADNQTVIGAYAGRNVSGGDAAGNIIIGYRSGRGAGLNGGTGGGNFFAGYNTAYVWGAAHDNIAIGENALNLLVNGSANIALGKNAGSKIVSNVNNILIGTSAGRNTTGDQNVFVGSYAGFRVTTGDRNQGVGRQALSRITVGTDNIGIGYNSGPTADTSNKLFINIGESDTPLIGGDFSADTVTINGELNISNTAAGSPSRFSEIHLHDNVNSAVTVIANAPLTGSPVGDTRFQLPANNGIANYVLITDGSGNTSWSTVPAGSPAATVNNWLTANNGSDFGTAPSAAGTDSIALGFNATAPSAYTVAIGKNATTAGVRQVAIGFNASTATGAAGIAIGDSAAISGGSGNVVIGDAAATSGLSDGDQVVIGKGASSGAATTVVIGDTASSSHINTVSIGNLASATYKFGVAIGQGTVAYGGVAIGNGASGTGYANVVIGKSCSSSAGSTVAVGYSCSAGTTFDIAMGRLSSTASSRGNSIAIGNNSDTAGIQSIAFGYNNNTADLTNQTAIGARCDAGSVNTDVAYSTKIGYGLTNANKNMLHLFSKGKLELYGDEAQFILPNYVGGSPAAVPANAIEGGLIYDSIAKGLLVYGGSPTGWTAVGGTASTGTAPQVTFTFSTTTATGDPGANTVRLNNASPLTTSQIYVNDTSLEGLDIGKFFGKLSIGDQIYLKQLNDDTKYAYYEVDAEPVDGTGWWTVNVIADSGFAGTQPDNGATVGFIRIPGQSIGRIGTNIIGGVGAAPGAGNNISIGNNAGSDMSSSLAFDNIIIGTDAGRAITSGDRTIAIGDGALGDAATTSNARDYIFIGRQAGYNAVGSSYGGVCIGRFAGRRESGFGNVMIGDYAGNQSTANTGSVSNTAVGRRVAGALTTGDNNTLLGVYAGQNISTGSGNICIGDHAGPTTNQSDQLFINSDTVASNTPLIHGNFSTGDVTINGNLTVTGASTGTSGKPLYEQIVVGSPPSNVINTTIPTVGLAGSPNLEISLLVYRNGILQDEDLDAGSPALLTEDYMITGANQITFADGLLQVGGKIKLIAFT